MGFLVDEEIFLSIQPLPHQFIIASQSFFFYGRFQVEIFNLVP